MHTGDTDCFDEISIVPGECVPSVVPSEASCGHPPAERTTSHLCETGFAVAPVEPPPPPPPPPPPVQIAFIAYFEDPSQETAFFLAIDDDGVISDPVPQPSYTDSGLSSWNDLPAKILHRQPGGSFPNGLWLLGGGPGVVGSADNGASWSILTTPAEVGYCGALTPSPDGNSYTFYSDFTNFGRYNVETGVTDLEEVFINGAYDGARAGESMCFVSNSDHVFVGTAYDNLEAGYDAILPVWYQETHGVCSIGSAEFFVATLYSGIYRSVDGGANWTAQKVDWDTAPPWTADTVPFNTRSIAINPANRRLVICGSNLIAERKYISYSMDNGVTFTPVVLPELPEPYDTWNNLQMVAFCQRTQQWGFVGWCSVDFDQSAGVLIVYNEDFTAVDLFEVRPDSAIAYGIGAHSDGPPG